MVKLRASSAQRIALCPGSVRAAYGLEDDCPSSPLAERGERIHAWLANHFGVQKGYPALTAEEHEVAIALAEKTRRFIDSRGLVGPLKMWTEMHVERDGWSGHIDLVVEADNERVIVDWKTGWGDQVSPDLNAQLRTYAVLLDLAPCVAVLIQPGGRPEPVEFTEDDLEKAKEELDGIRLDALSAGAKRYPHPVACQYCPAFGRATCPDTSLSIERASVPIDAKDLAEMQPEELGVLGKLAKLAEKRIAQVKDEIRRRIEAGGSVPFCSIGAPSVQWVVTDIGRAFEQMPELDQAEFLKACTVSLPKLAEIYHAALLPAHDGHYTKAEARREVERLLSGAMEEKVTKGSLKIGGIE